MFTRRRWLVAGIAVFAIIAALVGWAANRKTHAEKLIQQKLEALRAAGEPVSEQDLANLFAPPPPEKDAMRWFTNAMEFASMHRLPYSFALTPGRNGALDEQSLAALRTYYSDTSAFTNLLREIPPGVRFGNHWELGILNTPTVPFVKVRSLMQSICTRALYAAEVGDTESASEMLATGFQFANAIPAESTLVEHMIRAATIGLGCSVTERCLNRAHFTDRQLERVLQAMPPPDTNGFAGTLRVEHCLAIWTFSTVKAGKNLDKIVGSRPKAVTWKDFWKQFWPRHGEYKDEDFITYLDMIPAQRRMIELPPIQAVPECARIFDAYESNVTCEVATMILPQWSKALSRHFEMEAQIAATKLALAIERFRATNGGNLPKSLAELPFTPPRDLFDGQPMRFKLLTNGYVVYSIGADSVDNGGLERTNSTWQTNYDITVTVER